MKYTETLVQNELVRQTFPNHEIKIPNIACLYGWECDLVSVTTAGIVHEFEIKTTRSDWLAEIRSINKDWSAKKYRSILLENSVEVERRIAKAKDKGWKRTVIVPDHRIDRPANQSPSPNYWWIVAPVGVVKPEEIPDYAGLIEYENRDISRSLCFDYVKPAPKLHKLKISEKQWRALGRGAALRMWSIREKLDD